jgi:nicotinate phosphoribosyltransferase
MPVASGQPLGLHTDLYELRMAQTCLRAGMTGPATFSLYIRPEQRRPWFLAGGLLRALEVIRDFTFGPEELAYLRAEGFSSALLDWLESLQPSGEIWAVPEGTVMLADEPVLEVTAPLPQALLWETALINVVQQTTLIATKAARCVLAAQGRTVVDFGFRRAQGLETGIAAARAAYLGGIDATSNVEAARRYGIPASGTMAHALIQAFGDERAAFSAFAADHPDHAILLVDTYDTLEGVRRAIEVGHVLRERGSDLKGIRLDSGDLTELSRASRRLLDEAGFTAAVIIVSGRMDEYRITELVAAGAPIDGFGVGSSMMVSADKPTLDIVYKLVAYDGEPRAKYSEDKVLLPGPKQVYRDGSPASDVLATRDEAALGGEPLLAPVWRDGDVLCELDLEGARARAAAQIAALPAGWQTPAGPRHAPRPQVSEALAAQAAAVREQELR